MTAGRGRVIRAAELRAVSVRVPWAPRAPAAEEPPAEIDVVRERGAVVAIHVRCRCGLRHELELVPDAETQETEP